MTRYFSILLLFGLITVSSTSAQQSDIEAVLDDFHLAASEADYERYFGHLAEESIFLGTDITERWTKSEFQGYAEPHFSAGRGWTYVPQERHVYVGAGGEAAWSSLTRSTVRFVELERLCYKTIHGESFNTI